LALARRVVAAASLAAKEYALGVTPAGGQIVQPEEVDEAKLFIQQAQFDVSGLPVSARVPTGHALTRLLEMLDHLAPPDSVRVVTDALVARITAAAGGPKLIEQLPAQPPSLDRGAVVFREQCAACHGESGRGDGPKAKRLKGPPPANLTDPKVMGGTTLLEIFRRIAIGVPGTAMPEFAEDLPEEATRRLALVREEARRLGRLIDNVLTFSRHEQGKLRLEPRACVPARASPRSVRDSFRADRRRATWRPIASSTRIAAPFVSSPRMTPIVLC